MRPCILETSLDLTCKQPFSNQPHYSTHMQRCDSRAANGCESRTSLHHSKPPPPPPNAATTIINTIQYVQGWDGMVGESEYLSLLGRSLFLNILGVSIATLG